MFIVLSSCFVCACGIFILLEKHDFLAIGLPCVFVLGVRCVDVCTHETMHGRVGCGFQCVSVW